MTVKTADTTTQQSDKIWNKRAILFAKILILAGLILYLYFNINLNEVVMTFNNSIRLYIYLALTILPLNLYLQYKKWDLTVTTYLGNFSFSNKAASLFLGFSTGVFTPFRSGELFARALPLEDANILKVAALSFLDKLFTLVITAFCGSMASIAYLYYYKDVHKYIVVSLIIIILSLYLCLFGIIYLKSLHEVRLRLFSKFKWFKKYLEHPHFINLNKSYVTKMLLFSFGFYASYIIQFTLLFLAFSRIERHTAGTVLSYTWISSLIIFVKSIIPISIGEVGIRESAAVYFIQKIGENSTVGFNSSISLFAINVVIPAIIGLFFMLRKK